MLTAPWATLIVGLIGIAGVLATLWQRSRSEEKDRAHRAMHDGRTEWWRRYQWAAEQANQAENIEAQEFGKAVLSALTDETDTITASELSILRAVAKRTTKRDNRNQRRNAR